MNIIKTLSLASAFSVATAGFAVPVMPDFAEVPTGWTTDRSEPASFANVGTFEGRSDVLGIGIDPNSPPSGNGYFHTQGRTHSISGGSGSVLAADLFVDSSWEDSSNGHVRTDMGGFMTDGTAFSDYAMIGFVNYGKGARFRVADSNLHDPLVISPYNGWVDLTDDVLFGAWNSLAISFTGTSYEYYLNGSLVYIDSVVNGSTGFQDVVMQAFNFGDNPVTENEVLVPYTAHWSNSAAVPDSGTTVVMLGFGMIGLAAARRRFRK